MANEPYRFVKRSGDSIVLLCHPKYGENVWTQRTLRKSTYCAGCGDALAKGMKAFGPITNGYNRMERICGFCIVTLCREKSVETP